MPQQQQQLLLPAAVYAPATSLPSPDVSASPPKSDSSDHSAQISTPAQPTPHTPALPVDFSIGLAEHIARSIATSMAQWALTQAAGGTNPAAAGTSTGGLQHPFGQPAIQDPGTIQAITAAAASAAAAAATSMILAASDALQQRIADLIPTGMPLILPHLVDLMPTAGDLSHCLPKAPLQLPPGQQQQQQLATSQQLFRNGSSVNNDQTAGPNPTQDRFSQPQPYLPPQLLMQQQAAGFAYAQLQQQQQLAQLQWQCTPFSSLAPGRAGSGQQPSWEPPQSCADQPDSGSGQGEYHTANGSKSGSGQQQPSSGLNDGTTVNGSHTRASLQAPASHMLAQHPNLPSGQHQGRSVASVYTRAASGSPGAPDLQLPLTHLAPGGVSAGGMCLPQQLPAVPSHMLAASHHWSSASLQSHPTLAADPSAVAPFGLAAGIRAGARTAPNETAMNVAAAKVGSMTPDSIHMPGAVFVQQAGVAGSCGDSRQGVRTGGKAVAPGSQLFPAVAPLQALSRGGPVSSVLATVGAGWPLPSALIPVQAQAAGGNPLQKQLGDSRMIARSSSLVNSQSSVFLPVGISAEENMLFSSSMGVHGEGMSSGTGSGSAVDFAGMCVMRHGFGCASNHLVKCTLDLQCGHQSIAFQTT